MVSTKILSSTRVFNIDNNKNNVSWAANQHFRMISEGSCDTEADNSTSYHRNKLHSKIQWKHFKFKYFYTILLVYCKCSLGEHNLFSKALNKSNWQQVFEWHGKSKKSCLNLTAFWPFAIGWTNRPQNHTISWPSVPKLVLWLINTKHNFLYTILKVATFHPLLHLWSQGCELLYTVFQ